MKKFFIVAVLTVMSFMAYAESGDISAGVQFNYASKHNLMGLGANFQIEPVSRFRISPEFLYYFKNNHVSGYNVNLNFNYLVRVHETSTFYPIVGFSYANYKVEDFDGVDHYGANVGVGYEYLINSQFKFYVEQKYQILSKDWNQSVSTLGLRFTF